ncbi:flagellar hook-basal body complex protein FliE [Sphingomonas profundi]|uniref:flagellar hook-basal body complex protein FliE n=1 Tax=Alterirhizorhabdus profundi TaxID=2681549 RepID=UPI0012E73981|nr:flagellar hook-basal body complex protein FliE [Sphingomonas profundi]
MNTINPSSLLAMRNAILQQNSALQKAAGSAIAAPVAAPTPADAPKADFTQALRGALSEVNALQSQAGAASEAYEKGETTDIAAVMLSREQASVGFQATLQVRNKLLSAYKDIMSMPV